MDKPSIQSSLALMLWKPTIIKKKRCSRASLLLGRHAIMLTPFCFLSRLPLCLHILRHKSMRYEL